MSARGGGGAPASGSLPVTGFLFLSDSLLGDKKARVGTSVQTLVDVATISHFSILYLPVDQMPNTIGTCNLKQGYLKTNFHSSRILIEEKYSN